jgi:hypothetical protein
LVPIVSKSLFILLFLVALLSAGASLQTGNLRVGESSMTPRAELRADVASVKSDMREIWLRLEDAPLDFNALWQDVQEDYATIRNDAAMQAKTIARRISTLVNTAS